MNDHACSRRHFLATSTAALTASSLPALAAGENPKLALQGGEKVIKAAPVAGALRFELLSEGSRVKPSSVKRGGKRPSRSYGPRGRKR